MKLLLLEDEQKVADFVRKGLEEAGFVVEHTTRGEEALRLAEAEEYDIAVLDVMVPGLDGLSVIRKLREQKNRLPVLILSAKHTLEDRVSGIELGADDYLTKPFSFTELLVRVQALIRRTSLNAEPTTLQFADLEMSLLSREVTRAGQPLHLQPREFSLLEYFLRHPGRVLSKTFILEHVWGYDFDPQTNVVDVLVSRLRSKVDKEFEPKLIHTLRGVGYVLKA
ncbi:MAG: winged helix-turn-helix domain-containing protein [bacterium]|jgi:two-component system OmpR family response regulator